MKSNLSCSTTHKSGDNARIVIFEPGLQRFAVVQEIDDVHTAKLPGGSLQNGETVLEGATRESLEELGSKLSLTQDDFAGHLTTNDGKYDRYIFALIASKNKLQPTNEIAKVSWLTISEIPDGKHKQHIQSAVEIALQFLKTR